MAVCVCLLRDACSDTDPVSVCRVSLSLYFHVSLCTCLAALGVSLPVFALLCARERVCLKNSRRCRRVGGGMGKTQRSAITLKHAGPYLCHEA